MCGIAGVISAEPDPQIADQVHSMCDVLTHRGPDESGFYIAEGVALGMRRLSIIDLATGHQPVCSEDGRIHTILNGEIYNYQQLRRDLESRGHTFKTATDTETIVHLYEEYGEDLVHHLRGMFALAVWDGRRRRLLLARDRLGIKPLYYHVRPGGLAFASELKALLQLPEIERALNWGALDHLLTFLVTPPAQSIVAGVNKLEPGQLLTVAPGRAPQIRRYWQVRFQPDDRITEPQVIERLRAMLVESVALHRVSEVPVGAFLSGGLDSSAVAAAMAWQTSRPIKTFTIGFRDPRYDESGHARRMAAVLGSDHHELVLDPDITGYLDDIAWHLDEPFGDSSAIPTYMVSKLAAQQVTVVLSGDGGDELFAGYDRYGIEARERAYRYIPRAVRALLGHAGGRMPEGAKGRNFLRHIALEGASRYIDSISLFKPDERRRLFQPDVARLAGCEASTSALTTECGESAGHWLSRLQQWDLGHYLPLDILTKVDRMSMAHSIETRVPLLDHVLVEFAATIPPRLQRAGGESKHVFKRAMRGLLPDEIIDRPKQGFAVPLGAWFRGGLEGTLRDVLLADRGRSRGIFEPRYVRQLLAMHARGRPLDLQLWTLLSVELWCRTFLDGAGRRRSAGRAVGPVVRVAPSQAVPLAAGAGHGG